jgi:GNAT superfamily N-acetyltransferase
MTPYVIREARVDELPIIVAHRRRMFEAMGYTDPARLRSIDEASVEFFGRMLEAGTYRGWFVDVHGTVVAGGGVLILPFQPQPANPRPERPWIVNMFTEPEYRRRGLARRLLEEIVAWCRGQGFGVVALHASDEGRPLYESMGFTSSNEMRLKFE